MAGKVMLYRDGKGTKVWGHDMETTIVEKSDLKKYLSEGWDLHPQDVIDQRNAKEQEPEEGESGNEMEPEDLPPEEEIAIGQSNDAGAPVPMNNNGNPSIVTTEEGEREPGDKQPKTKAAKKSS